MRKPYCPCHRQPCASARRILIYVSASPRYGYQLARFPRADLTRRFGPTPVLRLEQALGQAGESLNPYLPPPQFQAHKNCRKGSRKLRHWLR